MSSSAVNISIRKDPGDRLLTVCQWQDVEGIVEHNKRLANEQKPRSDWGRHYATIPHIWRYKWWDEAGGDMTAGPFSMRFENEVIAKKLEDPEFRAFRVDLGPSFQLGWRAK
jgi:hypothetical protein